MRHEEEEIFGETVAREYDYDARGRLSEVRVNGVAAAHYTYDANGNRLSRTSPAGTETGTYDDRDRVQSYGRKVYSTNANGYVHAITDTGTGAATLLDYNVRGWLRGVRLPDGRAIKYDVDPLGRRTGRRVDNQLMASWVYRDGLRPLVQFDAGGQLVWRFYYGERSNVPSAMVRGSTVYRVFSDLRGSVRLVVDASNGEVAQRIDYDEFGRVLRDTNPGFQPFGFAGGLYDADTGLVRYRARDYDAYAGRWTARDPILFGGARQIFTHIPITTPSISWTRRGPTL